MLVNRLAESSGLGMIFFGEGDRCSIELNTSNMVRGVAWCTEYGGGPMAARTLCHFAILVS